MTKNKRISNNRVLAQALAIVVYTLPLSIASAASCHLEDPSISKDSKAVMGKIRQHFETSRGKFNPLATQRVTAIADSENLDLTAPSVENTRYKLDRSNAILKQYDSVGLVTGFQYENQTKNLNFGTGVLISACHVISNRHVITSILNLRQDPASLDDGHINIVGKKVFFSVGQTSCSSVDHFMEKNLEASVIAAGKNSKYVNEDWVILKLSKKSRIVPAKLSTIPLMPGTPVVMVGYPDYHLDTDNHSLRYSSLFFTKVAPHEGSVSFVETRNAPGGSSGSGIFSFRSNPDGPFLNSLHAIHSGDGSIVHVAELLLKMTEDLQQTLLNGQCE